MKITFLGGADEVGGSSLLIEIAGRQVLVDAGIRPSPKARRGLAGDQLPHLSLIGQAGGLDAVLVTHAHTDHTGALELVAGHFPDTPIYSTPVTVALTRVLHQDSRRIMQSRLEEEGELPLFDDLAVSRLLSAMLPVPFYTRIPLADGLVATFYPAGHIAGAAMIGLESEEGRILVSGDVSVSPQRTVEGAKPPPFHPDVLVLESTYGGRLHANRSVQERLLVKSVSQVIGEGGKVLIPAFALGRAQELLLILDEFRRHGDLPDIHVWADGMVRAICRAYAGFPEALPLPLQERGASFFNERIRPVETAEQRDALVWQPDPLVIVASSGMLAGGPSQSYARALAGKPQHAILLTGYQDEESPGRRLQELAERGSGSLWLGKDKVEVQCRLGTYSLSAHADEGQLVSLAETLDPQEIVLVHGDENARYSLGEALKARSRWIHLPQAGQTLEFHFAPRKILKRLGIGENRLLDIGLLWKEMAGPGGGIFLLEELARAWWGEIDEESLSELHSALARDDLYFITDINRPELYRARTPQQVERSRQRREKIAELGLKSGQWLALSQTGGSPYPVLCLQVWSDYFQVQTEEGAVQSAWPEDVAAVFGESPPDAEALFALGLPHGMLDQGWMEPNQALALAAQQFPLEARLRRCGYRLDERILILTFDFPDVARQRFAEQIETLQSATGWQVEISPEPNQEALNILARTVLPEGWRVRKGPAIYREQKLVALTVEPPQESVRTDLEAIAEAFRQTSGYALEIAEATPRTHTPASLGAEIAPGERLEINAAYALIKHTLAGSSLYRTSLKGDEIVLSFISPQVGARYREEIETLSRKTGWSLSINPQANQGMILETARVILVDVGWMIQKGPGLYPERGEVCLTLAAAPDEQSLEDVAQAIQEKTGYRMVVNLPRPAAPSSRANRESALAVEIPLARIRLSRHYQGISLDPDKLAKTIERARRMGQIAPPIRVRRLKDSYLLLDGFYRLQAATELGFEQIRAVVE